MLSPLFIVSSLLYLLSSTYAQSPCPTLLTQSDCSTNTTCTWYPPQSTTNTNIPFTPGGPPITPFSTVTTTSTQVVDGATIVVAEGFDQGDLLSCDPRDCPSSSVTVTMSAGGGVLLIQAVTPTTASGFIRFLNAVKFSTSSYSPRKRVLSFVLGYNMVKVLVPSTSSLYFFRVCPAGASDQTCLGNNAPFSGLTPRWGSILSSSESNALRTLRLNFIAKGSDNKYDGTCTWTWEGVPLPFWTGCRGNGSLPFYSFAQWDLDQPRPSTARQVVFVSSYGAWTAVNESFASGYGRLVRYGRSNAEESVTIANINGLAGEVTLPLSGCAVGPCSLPEMNSRSPCLTNSYCTFDRSSSKCRLNGGCSQSFTNEDSCNYQHKPEGVCLWDNSKQMCKVAVDDTVCGPCESSDQCGGSEYPTCRWLSEQSVCVSIGCTAYSIESECNHNVSCRWSRLDQSCVSRKCGYIRQDACWEDTLCLYDIDSSKCVVNPCVAWVDAQSCNRDPKCEYNVNRNYCNVRRCTASNAQSCQTDSACTWRQGKCQITECSSDANQRNLTLCAQDDNCYVTDTGQCWTDPCPGTQLNGDCGNINVSACTWDLNACRHKLPVEITPDESVSLTLPSKLGFQLQQFTKADEEWLLRSLQNTFPKETAFSSLKSMSCIIRKASDEVVVELFFPHSFVNSTTDSVAKYINATIMNKFFPTPAPPSSSGGGSSTNNSNTDTGSSSSSSSGSGVAIGIAVAVVITLISAGGGFYFFVYRKRMNGVDLKLSDASEMGTHQSFGIEAELKLNKSSLL